MSSRIRKSLQDLQLGIDDTPVALPPQFLASAASANRFALVVNTVNPRKQNLRAMIGYLPRVWGFADTCVGRILGPGRVLFVFQSEESLNLVLRRGPWSFNEWMLTVYRWFPNISDDDMKIIPFWVQIRGIPLLYLSADMARYVGDQLGPVTTVDFDENANMVEFTRVRIDWNIDWSLRFCKNFQFAAGDNTVVKYRFERLRNFCSKCGSLKHDVSDCDLDFDDGNDGDSGSSNGDDSHHSDADVEEGQSENSVDMSAANTLQTIQPFDPIPGIGGSVKSRVLEIGESSVPSVFEDTELIAERLRYLHKKYGKRPQIEVSPGSVGDALAEVFAFTNTKRKRSATEAYYRQMEAAEDLAVLSRIRKRERVESEGSCCGHTIDRGAGGPVPPEGYP